MLLITAIIPAAVFLPRDFTLMIVGYVLISSAYSFWLKTPLLVDVILLAGLYTWRVLAGGAATEIVVSPWLMAFCIFLFLSLAFAKRYVELRQLADSIASNGKRPRRFSDRTAL
jgi:4-hydroxybenzoate polyprenyltransferase